MSRPKQAPSVTGVFIIDKPAGMTSFDVIRRVRRVISERKIGHAGTLDPMATGVLLLLVGHATRLSNVLMSATKAYRAEVTLGTATDTDDAEGEVIAEAPFDHVTPEAIHEALAAFVGGYEQMPPSYSAIRVQGRRAYDAARRGEALDLAARPVVIEAIEAIEVSGPHVRFDVRCGKGTYIRSLARDLGERLATRAHLSALRRTLSAGFHVAQATPLDALEADDWRAHMLSLYEATARLETLDLSPDDARRLSHGQRVRAIQGLTPGVYRVPIPGQARLLALVDASHSRQRPDIRVFEAEWSP